jgi:hypothetical protein
MTFRRGVRRILLIVASVAFLAAMVPLYRVGVIFGLWQPLRRPPGVSPYARYVSLVEEGTWFDCHVDEVRDVDVCKAWDEDGQLIADGCFRLEEGKRAASKSELHPSHVARGDGHVSRIDLFGKDGAFSQALVPVENCVSLPAETSKPH